MLREALARAQRVGANLARGVADARQAAAAKEAKARPSKARKQLRLDLWGEGLRVGEGLTLDVSGRNVSAAAAMTDMLCRR